MKHILIGIVIVIAFTGIFKAAEKTTLVEAEQIPVVGRYQLCVGGETGSYIYRIDTTTGKVEYCSREWGGGAHSSWKQVR